MSDPGGLGVGPGVLSLICPGPSLFSLFQPGALAIHGVSCWMLPLPQEQERLWRNNRGWMPWVASQQPHQAAVSIPESGAGPQGNGVSRCRQSPGRGSSDPLVRGLLA